MSDLQNYSVMRINDYEVWVSLGCSQEEQSYKQPVLFNLEIEFHVPVRGELSDQLTDAIDYVAVTDLLKLSAESKSYRLIESMCFEATEKVSAYLKQHQVVGLLKLSVLKQRPPVLNLNSGVSWTCQRRLS
jgi:dihydroneopterin aldolase